MTYTYAILDISPEAYREIKSKLKEAGYDHAFHGDVIDMHGIALQAKGHDWKSYANGMFCRRCGATAGSGVECR